MFKHLLKTYLVLAMLVCCSVLLLAETLAEVPLNYNDSNVGTIENPYQISSLANLRWLSETEEFYATTPQRQIFTYFIQTTNIDASETRLWNNGRGFMPIGLLREGPAIPENYNPTTYREFYGSYNGNNCNISDLYIHNILDFDNSEDWVYPGYFGLFGIAVFSEFINIHLVNNSYTCGPFGYTGSLIGMSEMGIISNCSTSGDIFLSGMNASGRNAGGLVGFTHNSFITYCFSRVNIIDNNNSESISNGTQAGIGGLIGKMSNNVHLTNSFYLGNILSNASEGNTQGGLVGHISQSVVDKCYVSSRWSFVNAGGVFGRIHMGNSLNEPSTTLVSVSNTFWDVNTTGVSVPFLSITTGFQTLISGLSTSQMKQAETFIEAGWDFDEIWGINSEINNGYPYLRNMYKQPTGTSPTDLTAIIESNQVILSWQAPTGGVAGDILGYNIYRNSNLLATTASQNLSFIDNSISLGAIYTYGVSSVHLYGLSRPATITTAVSDTDETNVPSKNRLLGNYPNPFNPSTTIKYHLAQSDNVRLRVCNIKGQVVKTLVNSIQETGHHSVIWNGDDHNGSSVVSGVYFYRLETNNHKEVKRMLLLK